jgi:hypothetical protein
MMDAETIFAFFIIIALLACGCSTNNTMTDNDRYLKDLEEYTSQLNQTESVYQGSSAAPPGNYAADMKNLSATWYDKVAGLNVTPEFALSKKSFLQTMKEWEAIADFMMSPAYKNVTGVQSAGSLSEVEKEQIHEFNRHTQTAGLLRGKIFNPDVCSAGKEKYENLTRMCQTG